MNKFKRWFLGLLGGVPKSDYDIVIEQRENFISDLKINNLQIKKLQEENELLKKQIARDPTTPVIIRTQNIKLREIKKFASISSLPLDQTEFCLRDAVLEEVSPFIRIEHRPSNQTVTATLLLATVEELAISKEYEKQLDEFADCKTCLAWSGSDCTRNPYTEGCLKEETK